jgi:ApaG protein
VRPCLQRPLGKCNPQLTVTTDDLRRVAKVRGPGVIGDYPILRPGAPLVSYQSQTPLRRGPTRGGTMRGSFTFVRGTIEAPAAQPFEADCAPFPLEVPQFVY